MVDLPNLSPGEWILFVHVASAYGLLFAHGASAFITLRLKKERELERVRALLDLSQSSLDWTRRMFGILAITGFIGAVVSNYVFSLWMWSSVVLFIVMLVPMFVYGMKPFNEIRKAAGQPFDEGTKKHPAIDPVKPEELRKLLEKLRPDIIAATSFPILLAIIFVMMFKPF